MIDFHSHILPNMDDGSSDVAESIKLLEMLKEQGIDTVVATPHFYANNDSIESFIDRRNKTFGKLKDNLPFGDINILLGAEVSYYQGISHLEDLKKLCIEGTNILILEMPFKKWTEYTIREVIDISLNRNVTLVLAHIDRYFSSESKKTWKRLRESGILMQVNASHFVDFKTRRNAISLIKKRYFDFLGSDCHNISDRPPCIGHAYEIIKTRFGSDFLNQIDEYNKDILSMNK